MARNTRPHQEDIASGYQILERIEENLGIALRPIFEDNDDPDTIRQAAREAIIAAMLERAARETPSEEWPNAGQEVDLEALLGSPRAGTFNLIPAIAVTQTNLKVIAGYQGAQIHQYVKTVTNGLSLIKDGQTAGQVAAEIIGSGIAAFAIAMIVGTIKALKAGNAFRAALTLGVRSMGSISVIVGVVAIIVIELLIYLMVNNKKVFLGMVFNDTDLNLVVKDWQSGTGGADKGDLFMATGSMTAFMETHENESLTSPLVQIPARSIIAPGDPDNVVMGGLFCAEKNFGLFGTEGAMVLADNKTGSPRFAFQFACPYVQDNGINVAIDTAAKKSAKDHYNQLFPKRSLNTQTSGGGYTFSARCNAKSGGEAAGVAVLQHP